MGERIDAVTAARVAFAEALRSFSPSMDSAGHTIAGKAMRDSADLIDAQAADISTCDATIADLRAQLDARTAERDEARGHYRFMVDRAADVRLDGYRELGARAAAAENALDAARVGVVTVEAHARAVREAWQEARGINPLDVRMALSWATARARITLLTTLRAAGVSDADAVALADGQVTRG